MCDGVSDLVLTAILVSQKALNLFNAAMVTPTYYVYFTSTTIITSAVLFQGFKGTATSIVTVVNGFLTICSGVVLLQLSKSAKDVPDAAVFAGNLDQIHTIAEQEQPETEPKADAIRGTAAIVRRFSVARQNMEMEELRRLHEEKKAERLAPVSEDGSQAPEFEWDGLRRRRTIYGSQRSRAMTSPNPYTPVLSEAHPPLGWSHFPTHDELVDPPRPQSPGVLSSIAGTIRSRARSVLGPGHPNFQGGDGSGGGGGAGGVGEFDPSKVQSPMHPVQLTEIAVPSHSAEVAQGSSAGSYYGRGGEYGLPAASKTEYEGSAASIPSSSGRRVQFGGDSRNPSHGSLASSSAPTIPPEVPPHSAKRQFSFQNVFKRHQQHGAAAASSSAAAGFGGGDSSYDDRSRPRPGITSRGYSSPQVKGSTEEERLGLVKGDSNSMPALPSYSEEYEEDDEPYTDDKQLRYGRGITTPPRRGSDEKSSATDPEVAEYEAQRRRFNDSRSGSRDRDTPPPPPPGGRRHSPPRGGDGAFI